MKNALPRQRVAGSDLALNALLAVLYIVAAEWGYQLTRLDRDIPSTVWLPAGLSLAALCLCGWRIVPGIVVGSLSIAFKSQGWTPAFVIWSFANITEPCLGYWLLNRYRIRKDFQGTFDIIRFALICAATAAYSAIFGLAGLIANQELGATSAAKTFGIWAISNFGGDMTLAPAILVWSVKPNWNVSRWLQFGAAMLLTFVISGICFRDWLPQHSWAYAIGFTLLGIFFLSAIQLGAHAVMATGLLFAMIAITGTAELKGALSHHDHPVKSLLQVWACVIFSTLPAMLLAASVHERRAIEQQLREANDKLKETADKIEEAYKQLQAIIDFAPTAAIQGYDLDGRVLFWNKASERIYGFTEQQAVGQKISDFLLSGQDAKDFEEVVEQIKQTQQPSPVREWELTTSEGEICHVVSSMFPIYDANGTMQIICMDIDITDRKRLEVQLARAQKLDSIGRLAGGVAHDFNNLLTAIIGYAEMAQESVPNNSPENHYIDQILKASDRAADLVKQLLAFARRQVMAPRLVQMNEVLMGMQMLLQRLVGEHIEMRIELSQDLPSVKADPAQLEQVIINLVSNARDAMPMGGELIIRTQRRSFPQDTADVNGSFAPGGYVELVVQDSGSGMSQEVMQHIFEPFFTTKHLKGTGLGLAMVYGIIKQSGGEILVTSEPGKGTTFSVLLPEAQEEESALNEQTNPALAIGSETVLVVEDQETVREVATRALRAHGYRVLEAINGEQALFVLASHGQPIHLLITDVLMPRMGGIELADRVRAEYPDVRVLFITGNPEDLLRGEETTTDKFLQKPFTAQALAQMARDTLDEPKN
ncbi:MAG: MASE1 domain-containing protein [Fimbriimonadia bacterium]|nr:MASE1 domain-containing protein [Fimbriimonadia bacterium]